MHRDLWLGEKFCEDALLIRRIEFVFFGELVR